MEDKPTQDVKDDSADGEDNAVSSEKEDGESGEGKAEQSVPDCAGDQKADDGEKVSAESDDPVDDSKEEEKVEVKEEEKDVTDPKEEEEVKKITSEVKEENVEKVEEEEDNSEAKQSSSDSKSVSPTEEQGTEEATARRYPTRGNRGEQKAALDLAGGSGTDDSNEKEEHVVKKDEAKETKSKHGPEEEDSVKSDGGSDKENLNGDAPMDLSNAGTPDVIMLSDEEETEEQKKQSQERMAVLKKRVRHLQSELRNEEAKLVLLKKLRQSQLAPPIQEHPPMPNSNSSQPSKQSLPRQPGGPPPLVRGGQQGRGANLHIHQHQGRSSGQGHMRNMQGPPPLVGTPRGGLSNTNGNSSQGMRSAHNMSQHGSSNHRAVQQQQSAQHQQASTPPQPPVDTQTPAQRQAAAKLALRKQLEKTLLQIPPPKPPAPEMNFIPSLACPDFVLLLGLEEVVNHIIDLQLIARGQKSPDEKFICNPFTCVQCGTDYTPVWKREKPGSKNVICEHCVTWNQKRALKQEHTNRLKSAFVKALQQEQEIERMQAPTPSAPSTPTPSATPPASMSSAPPQALAAAAAASNVAAAAAMSMNPSFRASAEQVRQHHNFLQQAHQAQLRAGQPLAGLQGFGGRAPFPYTLPYVKQADLQRQYLLDMIPRAGMPWKP